MADRIVRLVPPAPPVAGFEILNNFLLQARGALALLQADDKCNTDGNEDVFQAEQLLKTAIAKADELFACLDALPV